MCASVSVHMCYLCICTHGMSVGVCVFVSACVCVHVCLCLQEYCEHGRSGHFFLCAFVLSVCSFVFISRSHILISARPATAKIHQIQLEVKLHQLQSERAREKKCDR